MPACHAGGRGFESRPVRQIKIACINHSAAMLYKVGLALFNDISFEMLAQYFTFSQLDTSKRIIYLNDNLLVN